jgi:hypothetical protein
MLAQLTSQTDISPQDKLRLPSTPWSAYYHPTDRHIIYRTYKMPSLVLHDVYTIYNLLFKFTVRHIWRNKRKLILTSRSTNFSLICLLHLSNTSRVVGFLITVFTTSYHWMLSWASSIKLMTPKLWFFKVHFNITISSTRSFLNWSLLLKFSD